MMSLALTHDVREFWREFIEIYKSFPSLWKVKSDEYKNRKLKDQCYQVLVNKLKKIEPDADRHMVRKKVNILRSNFRRELNKVRTCNGKNGGEKCKSTLWYFEDMLFLSNQELENGVESAHTVEIECMKDTQNEALVDPFIDFDCKSEVLSEMSTNSKADVLEEIHGKVTDRSVDEIEIQGKLWASEFRKLDTEQQLFAKKAIDDILFEGRVRGLNRFSVQINAICNNN